jgi:hypothetical protein
MLYSLNAMTTYGHVEIFLAQHRRLMGALEALNGMMLFGLTTAFLFGVLQRHWPVPGALKIRVNVAAAEDLSVRALRGRGRIARDRRSAARDQSHPCGALSWLARIIASRPIA